MILILDTGTEVEILDIERRTKAKGQILTHRHSPRSDQDDKPVMIYHFGAGKTGEPSPRAVPVHYPHWVRSPEIHRDYLVGEYGIILKIETIPAEA